MKVKDFLASLGISEALLQAIPDNLELPETKKRPRPSRGSKVRPKTRVEGVFFKAGNSTYKVECPWCGQKVWADYHCSACGRVMEKPSDDFIPAQRAREIYQARKLARKWGYEVIKKEDLARLKKQAGEG